MPQNYKVYTDKNLVDTLFQKSVIGFEFVSDYEYQVVINGVERRAKVAMPNGTIIDNEFEYYFQEDEFFEEHNEFHEWLKFLLMSFEFYTSDNWENSKK